jgi:Mg2+ and Co2+ transporter CorA
MQTTKEEDVPLAIAGTGYGIIGILVIVLLVVLILYFVRRA